MTVLGKFLDHTHMPKFHLSSLDWNTTAKNKNPKISLLFLLKIYKYFKMMNFNFFCYSFIEKALKFYKKMF